MESLDHPTDRENLLRLPRLWVPIFWGSGRFQTRLQKIRQSPPVEGHAVLLVTDCIPLCFYNCLVVIYARNIF